MLQLLAPPPPHLPLLGWPSVRLGAGALGADDATGVAVLALGAQRADGCAGAAALHEAPEAGGAKFCMTPSGTIWTETAGALLDTERTSEGWLASGAAAASAVMGPAIGM